MNKNIDPMASAMIFFNDLASCCKESITNGKVDPKYYPRKPFLFYQESFYVPYPSACSHSICL